jgi:hypothetical protein
MNQILDHDLDLRCINTARVLSVDISERARSGHPGLPLGDAPIGYTLWDRYLRHNPANPRRANRDRKVLMLCSMSPILTLCWPRPDRKSTWRWRPRGFLLNRAQKPV